MFCEKCGKKLEEGNKFCPYCGYKLEIRGESFEYVRDSFPEEYEFSAQTEAFNITGSTDLSSYSDIPSQMEFNPQQTGNSSYGYPVNEAVAQPVRKKSGAGVAMIVILVAVLILGVAFGAFWIITDGELFESDLFNKEETHQEEKNEEEETSQNVTEPSSPTTLNPDTYTAEKTCYVNVETVTLYKGPDTSVYKAVCNASKDEALVIKGSHSKYPDWLYVYSAKTNEYGWISSALVSEKQTAELPTTDVNSNTEVIYYDAAARFDVMINVGEGHNLNLRRQPDTADPDNVILLIPDRAKAKVLGVSRKDSLWYYVEYTDEFATYYGYIHSDHTIRYY